ncbi:MAG: hypothetical protein A2Z44_06400 [Betaproteobacteria bacterium RBG_19FT_COMBO_58_11]|nr:MAG: hypothetical protein A2Z44_06400 [Betaproteobacteria bacterium RBG_19FT_COMBO_58_11]
MQGGERAAYGEEIVSALSRQLASEYGRGFAEKNLRRMVQFAEAYPDEEIVVTLLRQLSWSHFLALIPLDKLLQRDFYAEMSRIEGWSVRTLRERIASMLYERTALSKKPDELIQQELANLRSKGEVAPRSCSKTPTCSIFSASPTAFWSATSKTPSCASWGLFCSNSAQAGQT